MAVKVFKKLWVFCLVMCALIFITSQFAATISTNVLTISVGIVIILFVVTNVFLKKFTIPDNVDKTYQFGFGAVAGVMGGITSLWAPPIVCIYFQRAYPKMSSSRLLASY